MRAAGAMWMLEWRVVGEVCWCVEEGLGEGG